MNGRIVAASILAALACGIVAGVLMLLGLDRSEVSQEGHLLVYFLPGLTYGALFVVFALMPLLFILRRRQIASRTALMLGGVGLWVLLVVLVTASAWNLPLGAWLNLVLPLLLPGVASVLVFAFVAGGRANAAG